jgi:lipopolysaccharide biosynthesis glycosyltransferase
MKNSIWIGFDPREHAEFAVARQSVERHSLKHWPIYGLVLSKLREAGLYTRPTRESVNSDGHPVMIDELSIREDYDGRVSTQHALSRFLVPHLAKEGWALFMDGDMMVRSPLPQLFASLDYSKALYCVHHDHAPKDSTKMDGQVQTNYDRKNWSSFVIFNCDHPANEKLTLEMVNTLPGRDLHRFCWLEDRHIGELDQSWNFLVGHNDTEIVPDNIHWTSGTPAMRGYENVPFAADWRKARDEWAQGCMSLPG